jgi:hypothetical protein
MPYTVMLQVSRMRALLPALPMLIGLSVTLPSTAHAQDRRDQGPALERALSAPTEALLRAHVRMLSHDLLEGRAPGTRGGELAAHYIATVFEALGFEGGGPDGSFYQSISLIGARAEPALVIGARRQTVSLEPWVDFVAWPTRALSTVTADGDIVFVGHGVRAPEWNWDDFKTSSLTGSVLLVLEDEPTTDSTTFAGPLTTRYATWQYKVDQAARMGAAGVLLVHRNAAAHWTSWEVVANTFGSERYFLDRPRESNLRFAAWITEDAARRIAEESGRDFDLLVRRAGERGFRPISMDAHAVMRIRSALVPRKSANVLAVVPGTDLAHEWVIIMSHFDHLGVGRPVGGDSIYNGARDNASGVAALLGVATGVAASREAPRRSLLFLATTGAESGYLGARALIDSALVPLERVAAVVNLDQGSSREQATDIVANGLLRSDLAPYLAAAAEREQLSLGSESIDQAAGFFTSDHLPFAEAGVPAVLVHGANTGRALRYHMPSDEYAVGFALAGLLAQVRLVIRLGWMLAATSEYPSWKTDSEFRAAGDQLRLRRLRGSVSR